MLERLVDAFSGVPDPRCTGKVVHRLLDIVVIAVCAVIAGAESWEDIALYGRMKRQWLSSILELTGGIPSHDTFRRARSLIEPQAFERCFLAWAGNLAAGSPREVIAIDGKTMRGSFDTRRALGPLHILSAFATERGLALGQLAVDGKSNEITAIPELLDALALEGTIVTLDAMGCQKTIATKILEHKADYVLALKGNQGTLHRAVVALCAQQCFGRNAPQRAVMDAFDDSHGRTVRRRAFACAVDAQQAPFNAWPGLRQVLAVETIRQQPGKSTVADIRYYLSSCADAPEVLARAIRQHWGIENRLHWVLDVSFREDACRIHDRHAARVFAVLRKIAMNLIRQDAKSRASLKGRRKQAAWSNDYMEQVLRSTFQDPPNQKSHQVAIRA